VAVVRDIEPWDGLLEAGREDERLVVQSAQNRRSPRAVAIPEDLHPDVAAALSKRGIDRLWSHQAEALSAAWDGPAIVTTGTASGKSLCFNLPTLEVLSRDARARALYLYPAKALAQDQARALHALAVPRARPAIYDGDTPREQRSAIRRRANLVLTNPDMLHLGILPNHPAWGDFFANLAVVVVDEAHVYRGVFGSHVANVLRRLRRIAEYYGTAPRLLLASATIANPAELAARLTGLDDFTVIDRDGSPGYHRTIAMWNPPIVDEAIAARRSALAEAADLLAELVEQGARTIVFMKSRKAVELMARFAKLALQDRGRDDLAERIAPYRAGYTPQQRRELERRLVDGELLGVVSTDALELGIDIGALDAAVCVTFPGTVASLRQMWGRAGPRARGRAV
jgi:DEAD/DEAH box helicase domain-containing protein